MALDTFDFWVGSVMIFFLAMVQAILYGWVLGIDRGEREAHRGAHIRIPRFVQYMLKYVVPVYLLAIFGLFCYFNLPGYARSIGDNPAAQMSILFIGVIVAFLMLLIHIAGRRWERDRRFENLDKFDQQQGDAT